MIPQKRKKLSRAEHDSYAVQQCGINLFMKTSDIINPSLFMIPMQDDKSRKTPDFTKLLQII